MKSPPAFTFTFLLLALILGCTESARYPAAITPALPIRPLSLTSRFDDNFQGPGWCAVHQLTMDVRNLPVRYGKPSLQTSETLAANPNCGVVLGGCIIGPPTRLTYVCVVCRSNYIAQNKL